MMRFATVAMALQLAGCGTAKTEGQDCPKPEQLQAGVQFQCGDRNVVGTMTPAEAPVCSQDGQVGCFATETHRAVAAASLDPASIKQGVTIGGVTGTFAGIGSATGGGGGGGSECIGDGQQDCVVTGVFAAVRTVGLDAKIAAGQIVAGISGIAVLNPPEDCGGNGDVGCRATNAYPAIEQAKLAACLAN